jgi:hypothetical protein
MIKEHRKQLVKIAKSVDDIPGKYFGRIVHQSLPASLGHVSLEAACNHTGAVLQQLYPNGDLIQSMIESNRQILIEDGVFLKALMESLNKAILQAPTLTAGIAKKTEDDELIEKYQKSNGRLNVAKAIQNEVISTIKRESKKDETRKEKADKIKAAVNPEEAKAIEEEEEVIEANVFLDYFKEAVFESNMPVENALDGIVLSYTVMEALAKHGLISSDPVEVLESVDPKYVAAAKKAGKDLGTGHALKPLIAKIDSLANRVTAEIKARREINKIVTIEDLLYNTIKTAITVGGTLAMFGAGVGAILAVTGGVIKLALASKQYALTKERVVILEQRSKALSKEIATNKNPKIKAELEKLKAKVDADIALIEAKRNMFDVAIDNAVDAKRTAKLESVNPTSVYKMTFLESAGVKVPTKKDEIKKVVNDISKRLDTVGDYVFKFDLEKKMKEIKGLGLADRKREIEAIKKELFANNKLVIKEYNTLVKVIKSADTPSATLEKYYNKSTDIFQKIISTSVALPIKEVKAAVEEYKANAKSVAGRAERRIASIIKRIK